MLNKLTFTIVSAVGWLTGSLNATTFCGIASAGDEVDNNCMNIWRSRQQKKNNNNKMYGSRSLRSLFFVSEKCFLFFVFMEIYVEEFVFYFQGFNVVGIKHFGYGLRIIFILISFTGNDEWNSRISYRCCCCFFFFLFASYNRIL